MSMLRSKGRIGGIEMEIRHPSGEKRHILNSIQYLNVDDNETLISTFIDITDRVHAERKIRSLASDLTAAEQEERNRISQILHDDLQQRIFAVKVHLPRWKRLLAGMICTRSRWTLDNCRICWPMQL